MAAVHPPAPGPGAGLTNPVHARAAAGNAAPAPGPRDGSADQRVEALKRELNEHKAVQELLAHLGTLLTDHERSLYSIADERDQSQLFSGARNPLHKTVIPRPDRFLLKPQFGAGAALGGAEGGVHGDLERALREMMNADPRASEGGRARLRDVDVAWLRHEEGTFRPRVLLEVEHSTLKSGSGLLRLLDVCAHYKNVVCIFVVKEEDEQRVRTLLRPDGAWRKVLHMMDNQETAKFAVIWQPDLVHGYSKVASGAPGHLSMSATQFIKEYSDYRYCSEVFRELRRQNTETGRAPAACARWTAGRHHGDRGTLCDTSLATVRGGGGNSVASYVVRVTAHVRPFCALQESPS